MPLNDDPEALDDPAYWRLVSEHSEPCPAAVPEDVLAEALARLDDYDDHVNGEQ